MTESERTPTRVCGIVGRVVANTRICREHVAVEVRITRFPRSEPGQFVELACGAHTEIAPRVVEWQTGGFPSLGCREFEQREAYLRRPFSIADAWPGSSGSTHVLIVSRSVGPGTQALERIQPGETLDVTGPLGSGFRIPPADVPMVLVGGGVGIPPLIYLARRLHEHGCADVTLIFGATTHDLLPLRLTQSPAADGTPRACADLLSGARFPTVITTDDGSLGMRGVVTDGLRCWHAGRPKTTADRAVVFACGPDGMLRAVAGWTSALGLDCQLCIERNMGCGLGTCLSCVVRVRDASKPEGWRWALTCLEGPVFDRDQLYDAAAPAAGSPG